ncbi:MAG: uracil-DNA glycosylase [Bradymonadales bacterium]|jgi:uracil-DNA glycosylase
MKQIFQNDWQELLAPQFTQDYYQELRRFLIHEYRSQTIHPEMGELFNALHYTACKDVKAVILGQDPYHGFRQAHGLSFSVLPPTAPPPSLVNIYKELHNDLGLAVPTHGYLKSWCDEGVLLLNAVLSVRHAAANSHRNKGWEQFTDAVIRCVSQKPEPVVFMLWGRNAQEKRKLIAPHHLVITAPHPSPLSAHRGFFGSRPFTRCNDFLVSKNIIPINWTLALHVDIR